MRAPVTHVMRADGGVRQRRWELRQRSRRCFSTLTALQKGEQGEDADGDGCHGRGRARGGEGGARPEELARRHGPCPGGSS